MRDNKTRSGWREARREMGVWKGLCLGLNKDKVRPIDYNEVASPVRAQTGPRSDLGSS